MNFIQLIVYLGILVAAIGLCCRFIPMTVDNVRFRDTDEAYAAHQIGQFAEGTYENRFGFPTGFFHLRDDKSQMPRRMVFQEAQPTGSVTDGCAVGIGSFGALGFDEGCLIGMAWLFVTAIVALPFIIVSAVDRLYRKAMQSKVTIDLRSAGGDSVATMKFYGISGYLTKTRYEKAFRPPALPVDLADPIVVPAPSTSASSGALPADADRAPTAESGPTSPEATTRSAEPPAEARAADHVDAQAPESPPTSLPVPTPSELPAPPHPAPSPQPDSSSTSAPPPPAKSVLENPSTPTPNSASDESATTPCRECGDLLGSADAFCTSCGASQSTTCRTCGVELVDHDRFCTECGTKR